MTDLTEALETTLKRLKIKKKTLSSKAINASKIADSFLSEEKETAEAILNVENEIKDRDEKKRVHPDSNFCGVIYFISHGRVNHINASLSENYHKSGVDDMAKAGLTFYTVKDADKKLKSMQVQAACDEGKVDGLNLILHDLRLSPLENLVKSQMIKETHKIMKKSPKSDVRVRHFGVINHGKVFKHSKRVALCCEAVPTVLECNGRECRDCIEKIECHNCGRVVYGSGKESIDSWNLGNNDD